MEFPINYTGLGYGSFSYGGQDAAFSADAAMENYALYQQQLQQPVMQHFDEVNFIPARTETQHMHADHTTASAQSYTMPTTELPPSILGLPPPPVGLLPPRATSPVNHQYYIEQDSSFMKSRAACGTSTVDVKGKVSVPKEPMTSTSEIVRHVNVNKEAEVGRSRALAILSQFQAQGEMQDLAGGVTVIEDESKQRGNWMAPVDVENRAQKGRSRAMEILGQIQEEAHNLHDIDAIPPAEWARRRLVCFEKLNKKYHLAMVKNLEYITRREDEKMQERLKQMQETKAYHEELEEYHAQLSKNRSKAMAAVRNKSYAMQTSQAGIGTENRQRAEKKRKQQSMSNDSVAIYVSNLPTDGSAPKDVMQALFGSYGSLRKIHFYSDKTTGKLKGDALVIYNTSNLEDKNKLTDTVCSQMNGAELPCGRSIQVQPSDPLYQLRKQKQTKHYVGTSNEEVATEDEKEITVEEFKAMNASGGKEVNDENDDLDDFFASL